MHRYFTLQVLLRKADLHAKLSQGAIDTLTLSNTSFAEDNARLEARLVAQQVQLLDRLMSITLICVKFGQFGLWTVWIRLLYVMSTFICIFVTTSRSCLSSPCSIFFEPFLGPPKHLLFSWSRHSVVQRMPPMHWPPAPFYCVR